MWDTPVMQKQIPGWRKIHTPLSLTNKIQGVWFLFIVSSFVVQISVQRDLIWVLHGFTFCGLKKAVLKNTHLKDLIGFEIWKLTIMPITSHFPLHLGSYSAMGGCSWLPRNSGSGEIFKWEETGLKRSCCWFFVGIVKRKTPRKLVYVFCDDQPTRPMMNMFSTHMEAP